MRLTNLALSSTLLLSLVACRGSDNNNGDDVQPMPDATVPGGEVTIMEVQNDAMPVGTQVTVKGVVVTAIDSFGNRTGDFFVQDPAGGPFSGVKVFGAPLDQVATLAVGDVIDISNAEKDEFALTSDMSGRKVTELKPAAGGMMVLTKKGTGAVPTPATVDALSIAGMPAAQQDAEWEKWEGVLITVTNARQLNDVQTFGSNPGPDSKEFDITGGVAVQTVLADFPATATAQTCYQGITGIGDYFFNYLLLPRSADDLVTGGSGCQASMVTTISAIQAGTATGPVEINDVFVAAVSFNKKNLWLTTSLTAAPNEGIYVFRGNGASVPVLDAAVVPGAKVNVVGNAVEGNNDQMGDTNTQITGASITVTAAPTATLPSPVTGVQASTLIDATTGEPYESVLVSLAGVKVLMPGDSSTFGVGSLQQGATTFLSDDDVLRLVAADANKCFDFVGVWTYQVFNNAFGLLPITKTEVTCP